MRRLGKLARRAGDAIPRLGIAAPGALPGAVDWGRGISAWPMLANDRLSDCTIAAALHAVQLWSAAHDGGLVPDEACAIADYAAATGYRPETGTGDRGAAEADILRYWMEVGFAIRIGGALDRLDGFAEIEPGDARAVSRAIAAFGCVYAGVELPLSAEAEIDAGKPWTATADAPGSWGGHAILLVGYDADGLACVTWGAVQRLSWGWWRRYGSEAYALFRRGWAAGGVAPSGLTLDALDGRIVAMGGALGPGWAFG